MLLDESKYLKIFTDMMSEGFIVIDQNGIIQLYNKRAMEIFNINQSLDKSHPSGKLEKGDIVIICNNSLGEDDGGLEAEDLSLIGLDAKELERGDAFIAIGQYRYKGIEPVLKSLERGRRLGVLKFKDNVKGVDIEAKLDFVKRRIDIRVNGQSYPINYRQALGHMLVLDRVTKDVKFFQHYGYTARDESLKRLLAGSCYLAKGRNGRSFRLIGKKVETVNKSDYIIGDFLKIARGQDRAIYNKKEEINGIATLCSILPVKARGRVIGAALKLEDISDIEETRQERDRAYRKLREAESILYEDRMANQAFGEFLGQTREIVELKRLALRAARNKSNLLILGDSGTGKSLLARLIHENSPYAQGPFVNVNCGTIANSLLESELFGYEEGAFTGAAKGGKKGYLEMADGGSIFLDEIGDLPMELQGKLLDTIQEKSFYKLGGNKRIQLDLRIITATNKNLEEEIARGNFREDLYYRINVFPIIIPALRERKEDINPLTQVLLPKICRSMGLEEKTISPEALKKLYSHNWPGNVRELENVLERAINLRDDRMILSQDIIISEFGSKEEAARESFQELVKKAEKRIIEQTLSIYQGDKSLAMESLDMSRSNFYKKLKDYNLL